MLNTKIKVVSKAFGLSIKSEIPLYDLSYNNTEDSIDVEVSIGDLSEHILEQKNENYNFVINKNQVLFQIPALATFLVKDGKKIIIDPKQGCEEDMLRLFILGTCMGVILMQRRIFPLHGSAIAINGKAYAIIGESGAGKSTLASTFINKGFKLLTDDVIAVSISNEGNPVITPSYPQQKLWKESLIKLGIEQSNYSKVYQREDKFAIPVHTHFSVEQMPLGGIFELVKSAENSSLKISKIEKLNRFKTLFNHTYRNFLIPKLGLTEWHFYLSTNIVRQTQMFQLQRPPTGFTANELSDMILSSIDMEEC